MSLYGMMRTGVSGMASQSTRLATVADNIANSGTNGYKRASVEFSSLVIPNSGTSYVSGGVSTQVRYAISQAGKIASGLPTPASMCYDSKRNRLVIPANDWNAITIVDVK